VWNPQDRFQAGFQKMKFLDFVVHDGNVLYIPPFWYYSIKIEDDDGLIYCADYGSPMNIAANTFNLGHYFYETMIPKKNVVKKDDDIDTPVL
jgi:ribosomal protein L16 Arg81 hydroxylase